MPKEGHLLRDGKGSLLVPWFPSVAYPYMTDLERLDACRQTMPTQFPPCLEDMHTPLPWQEWDRSLASHPNQSFSAYIRDGLRYGFQVEFDYRTTNPGLHISHEKIPFLRNNSTSFLGLPINAALSLDSIKEHIHSKLEGFLTATDQSPLSQQQNLKSYHLAICPHLTWLLTLPWQIFHSHGWNAL